MRGRPFPVAIALSVAGPVLLVVGARWLVASAMAIARVLVVDLAGLLASQFSKRPLEATPAAFLCSQVVVNAIIESKGCLNVAGSSPPFQVQFER